MKKSFVSFTSEREMRGKKSLAFFERKWILKMILIKKLVIKLKLIAFVFLHKLVDHNMKFFMPLQESFAVKEEISKYLD